MPETPLELGQNSALAIPVPEAEPLVQAWRARYDPSAALGVPAHITLLVPFLPPARIDGQVVEDLRTFFAGAAPIGFRLARLARFPDVLYLAPEPDTPFTQLITELARRYPETPPYGGVFKEVIPHLTVAHSADRRVLDDIANALAGFTPIEAFAAEVWLVVQDQDGRWHTSHRFPLGAM